MPRMVPRLDASTMDVAVKRQLRVMVTWSVHQRAITKILKQATNSSRTAPCLAVVIAGLVKLSMNIAIGKDQPFTMEGATMNFGAWWHNGTNLWSQLHHSGTKSSWMHKLTSKVCRETLIVSLLHSSSQ
jgi:hypothetical protein